MKANGNGALRSAIKHLVPWVLFGLTVVYAAGIQREKINTNSRDILELKVGDKQAVEMWHIVDKRLVVVQTELKWLRKELSRRGIVRKVVAEDGRIE